MILALLTVLGPADPVSADTARIVLGQKPESGGPVSASIMVTGTDGSAHTLGPIRFPARPHGLRRSPDGRYFAVPWGDSGTGDRGLSIVPTDGGAPFVVLPERRGGASYYVSPENLSWSSDSRDVVLGGVEADSGAMPGDVVRCSAMRRRCAALPGVDGYAATVPGGIVTATAARDLVAWIWEYAPGVDDREPAVPADGPTRRALVRRRHAQIALVTPRRTRALLGRRATVLDGVDTAEGIAGGPSGALVTVDRHRLRRIVRRGETYVRWGGVARRWVIVGRGGSTTTVKPRRLLVPRAHGAVAEDPDSGVMLIRAQRAFPDPQAGIASGGWLAVTGATPFAAGSGGLVLTTITPRGRATFVRVGGRIAAASHLVRSVLARPAIRGTAALVVVGHEASTNAAIVNLSWDQSDPQPDAVPLETVPGPEAVVTSEDADLRHHATVRVPLDGTTAPTVVSDAVEQAAW